MRTLITGANGQLGRELQKQLPQAIAVDVSELDISDLDQVLAYDWTDVDIILNAAAYTNVDGAETFEGRIASWKVNAQAVGNLAQVASEKGLVLIHISSDYVFDGTVECHTEEEAFSPLSVYGASKAAGDLLAATSEKHYILRTSWVIGEGKNFVRTMLSLAERGISPSVVSDQIGRLTFTTELARGIRHLLMTRPAYGTYNLTNDGTPTSWAEVTRKIFSLSGHPKLTVSDTTTVEYYDGKEGIAPRPLQSTLNLEKIKLTGFTPNTWDNDLKVYIEEEISK